MDPDFLTFLRLVEPAEARLVTTRRRGAHLDGAEPALCPFGGARDILGRLGARLRIAPGQRIARMKEIEGRLPGVTEIRSRTQ